MAFAVSPCPAAQAAEIKVGVLLCRLTGYIAFFGKMQRLLLRLAQKDFAKAVRQVDSDLKFASMIQAQASGCDTHGPKLMHTG